MGVAGLQAAEICGALLRRQTAIAFAGIAAEAEGLQVAEVVRAALVLLGTMGPSPGLAGAGFARQQPAPQHSQLPLARVSTRCLIERLIGVR
jgi:hypothetical protein